MTSWTLVLIVITLNGIKERQLLMPGFASEEACLTAAVALGFDALRWHMNIKSFDCLPGNL